MVFQIDQRKVLLLYLFIASARPSSFCLKILPRGFLRFKKLSCKISKQKELGRQFYRDFSRNSFNAVLKVFKTIKDKGSNQFLLFFYLIIKKKLG